jgi:hypothetical protein
VNRVRWLTRLAIVRKLEAFGAPITFVDPVEGSGGGSGDGDGNADGSGVITTTSGGVSAVVTLEKHCVDQSVPDERTMLASCSWQPPCPACHSMAVHACSLVHRV